MGGGRPGTGTERFSEQMPLEPKRPSHVGSGGCRGSACTTLEAMSPTHDALLALLDYRSEQEIETNLAKGIYGPDKRSLAELVLARKKLARMEAERAAEIEVTRKATEAAWENTKAARDASKRATWAIIISIASLAIAVATAMF